MANTEQTERTALPLAQAAAHLGITPDALRMRLRRGKADGFKRGRYLYVYVSGPPAFPDEQLPNTRGGSAAPLAIAPLGDVTRLLAENERLNVRLDQQLDEVRQLRQMLQREQVLRQQEYNLRQQIQDLLDRLSNRLALSAPADAAEGNGADAAKPPPATVLAPPGAAEGGDMDTDERSRLILRAAAQADADAAEPSAAGQASEPATPQNTESPAPSPEPGPQATSEPAAPDEESGDDLAEMLKEIGQSLRDIETSQPPPRPAMGAAASAEPSEIERRSAARVMTRLLRGRNVSRPRDTDT